MLDAIFASHELNEQGAAKVVAVKKYFNDCLTAVEEKIGPTVSREASLVRTALQVACMFAVKAVSAQPENQS